MTNKATDAAESTLQKSKIHEEWVSNYRTAENDQFYDMAFDHIAAAFSAPAGSIVLDAGCGSCAKSRKLVDRGFQVIGTDLSESALGIAHASLEDTYYADNIQLERQNLLDLTFADGMFRYAVCWGVLMHVPEVSKATAELARVMAPNGLLAISEGNMNSIQSRFFRLLKRLFGLGHAEVIFTEAGVENWEETEDGRLMTRQADMQWLIREFQKHGLQLESCVAGQFTELYWLAPTRPLKRLIHAFNTLWFRHIRAPGPAFGNILIFRKQA